MVCRVCAEMLAKPERWESRVFLVFQAALDPWGSRVHSGQMAHLAQSVFVASKVKPDQLECVVLQERLVQRVLLVFVAKPDLRA